MGGLELSYVGGEVFKGAAVTVAMALMATALACFCRPDQVPGCAQPDEWQPDHVVIYFIVRTLLNILRSIES